MSKKKHKKNRYDTQKIKYDIETNSIETEKVQNYNLKQELIAPFILIGILIIFFMPLLFQIEGICYDDAAFVSFPRLIGIARAFQNGELPLWDQHEFCGGKPYFISLESPIYNILYYPFFYLADLDNINNSFLFLYILPFIMLVIISGIGTYLLGRLYFKFSYTISILFGFLWAVNPSLGMSSLSTINTTVFSLMPWVILAGAQFLSTKKLRWWITGVIFTVLLNSAYTLNYTFRIYFILMVIFLILSIWYLKKDIKNLITVFLLGLIFITSFFLTAYVWAGIIEGIGLTRDQVRMSYSDIVSILQNNLPPAHLITLFIPNFNGSISSTHAWGDGLLIFSADRILTGGIFTSFSIIIASIFLLNHRQWGIKLDSKYYIWLLISLILNIGTLIVMLGKYTPVYFILCKILPWFFIVPYPYYYHFAHHFGAVLSAVLGITLMIKYKKEFFNNFKNKYVLYYIAFIFLFVIIYLFLPATSIKFLSYQYLTNFKEWGFFFSQPLLYSITASFILIYICFNKKNKFKQFKYFTIAAVFAEALYVGYLTYYKNMVIPRPQMQTAWEKMQRYRYSLPEKNPFFKQINEMKEIIKDNDYRWVSDVTTVDGYSWIINGKSMGGYDSKPLIKKLKLALKSFYERFPYELVSYDFPKKLLSNMNVGYLLAYNNTMEENRIYNHEENKTEYYLISKPETYKVIGDYFNKFKEPVFKVYTLDEPMPYLYFQDKLYKAETLLHREKLIKEDLRKFALLPDDITLDYPQFNENLKIIENNKNQFDDLQSRNQIISIKKYYNKLILNVKINDQVLLVRNEVYHPGWKVFVNNVEKKILEVNYLHQGVILEPGVHSITFKFTPKNIELSLKISLMTLIFTVVSLITFIIIKRFFPKK